MQSIIAADMSLDKDAFKQVQNILEAELKKILIPTGRSFINFAFEEKPNFDLASKEIEESEEDYPFVPFNMKATYNIHSVSGLYDEFAASISETRHSNFGAGICPLQSVPAYTKFTTMLGTEIEKKLKSTKAFINNKWKVHAMVEVKFNNEEGEYQDELCICLCVCVK